jgi:hypothetical protein
MTLLTRTWPYGTELSGRVEMVAGPNRIQHCPRLTVVLTDDGETHMMCGVTHEVCPSVRMRVAIRFVQDGPTGGYWKIVRTLEPAEAKP